MKTTNSFLILLSGILFLGLHLKVNAQDWSPLSTGFNDWVYATTVYNGKLIAGGKFTTAGGVPANHIASWNGSSWEPLGLGVNGKVNALLVDKGLLYVGGEFTEAGGMIMNFIATWNGTQWSDKLGDMGSTVTSLAIYNNRLIVGGYFKEADDVPLNYIAQRTDTGWAGLGSGTVGTEGQVMALEVYNNELIAGGFFTKAGGNTANHIAKWNGTSWSPLGGGISNIVYSLTNYNGNLIAGGLFLQAGGVPANHIASWNGSSWSPLGTGMSGVFYQYVFALKSYHGKLIAGGYFTHSGGVQTNGIAQWDGAAWSALGSGLFEPGNVYGTHTLSVFNDRLIVGGLFNTAGSASNCRNIAEWYDPNILAISLIKLNAQFANNKAELKWDIENDEDVTGYEIEKSQDGSLFNSIALLNSKKSKYPVRYQFTDNMPLEGNNFYRIKILRTNNETSYSTICKVVCPNIRKTLTAFSKPNIPLVFLKLDVVPKGIYSLSIFNNLGQKIYSSSFNHNGDNYIKQINLPYVLHYGIYRLAVLNMTNQFYSNLIIY